MLEEQRRPVADRAAGALAHRKPGGEGARDLVGLLGEQARGDQQARGRGQAAGELEEQRLHWTRDGDVLVTTVKLHDFAAALAFVNAVGAAAEAANHHPDIDIRWNKVHLVLTTHSAGGLTVLDIALAAAIDRLRPLR